MTKPANYVVMWRPNIAAPWEVQPHLWPYGAALALVGKLVREFNGEAWLSPVDEPTRLAVVREVPRDLESRP